MTQSIFEQQDILDKLFLQLKRDYQEGKTSEYNSLVSIAPTMTKEEYEQMIERFTAYMRGKEIDALNEHEVKLRSLIPFLPENMNTGLLGIELELLKHLSTFIVNRDLRVAQSVQSAFEDIKQANVVLQKELQQAQAALAKQQDVVTSLQASLSELKKDNVAKQQLIENISISEDVLDLLQCLNSGENRLSVESLPVNLKLREDMNDLLSRAQALSAGERAALSGMIIKAADLVKTAKALGFNVGDLKRTSDATDGTNPLQSQEKKDNQSESSRALGSVPPLPEEFAHLEQLGADDSYSDEFDDGEDVSVSLAKVAAALAAAGGAKSEKIDATSSLKGKLGDKGDILSRIGRGTADNMSELISAMQGQEGNLIARRLEARQARRDASMSTGDGTTEAQNYKAAELATLVHERTSTHAERIAAQSCLNALASGEEEESKATRQSIKGPVALAEKIRNRVNDAKKSDDPERLFGLITSLVSDLLKHKSVDELAPQDVERIIQEVNNNKSVRAQPSDVMRRLIIKSIFGGANSMKVADLKDNDIDMIIGLPSDKARVFARSCLEWARNFAGSETVTNADSDGKRPTQGSAISALISGVVSDNSHASAGVVVSADSKQDKCDDLKSIKEALDLAEKSLAQRDSGVHNLANVGAALKSEIEDIKSRFDAAFDSLNAKPTSVINAKPTSVINSSEPKALPREEGTLVRTMSADRGNENVAAFAEASAKIEKLAPLLHEAGKEIANARKELTDAITEAKVKEEHERLNNEYTPASKSLSLSSSNALGFGHSSKDDADKKEDKNTATDEITSVAKDVVKVAYALEEASSKKGERKESLFGGNAQGVTVFGADTRNVDEIIGRTENVKSTDADSSFIADGEDLSDFVTGNVNDIKVVSDDVFEDESYKEGQDFQVKHHMDPYEQGRMRNPESNQSMHTSLSQNTNVVVDNGKYNEPRVTNSFDIGTTSFSFGNHINPNAAPSEPGPVKKAADQLKNVLNAALSAGSKSKSSLEDGLTTTDTTAIIKSSAPPLAVDPTGKVMGADQLRDQQLLDAQKAKGDGPSTLITKTVTSTSDSAQQTTNSHSDSSSPSVSTAAEATVSSTDKEDAAASSDSADKSAAANDAVVVDYAQKSLNDKKESDTAAKEADTVAATEAPSAANGDEVSTDAIDGKVEGQNDTKGTDGSSEKNSSAKDAKDPSVGLAMLEAEFAKAKCDLDPVDVLSGSVEADKPSTVSCEFKSKSDQEVNSTSAESIEQKSADDAEQKPNASCVEGKKSSDAKDQLDTSAQKAEDAIEDTAKSTDAAKEETKAQDPVSYSAQEQDSDAAKQETKAQHPVSDSAQKQDSDAAKEETKVQHPVSDSAQKQDSDASSEHMQVGTGAKVLSVPSNQSNIFSSQDANTSGKSPFAVMVEVDKVFICTEKLQDEQMRTLNMVNAMLERKVGGHIKMVKETLSSAGSLSSFSFADFASYYSQCIDNLEADGYVNAFLKRILLDKMAFDLKNESISKLSFNSEKEGDVADPKDQAPSSIEEGAKNQNAASADNQEVDQSQSDTMVLDTSADNQKADQAKPDISVLDASSDNQEADQAQSDVTELESDSVKTSTGDIDSLSDNENLGHKEPGFVILDKSDTKDQSTPSKGGIASFVTNLFSGQKSDKDKKSQSGSKSTGFFILKEDNSNKDKG